MRAAASNMKKASTRMTEAKLRPSGSARQDFRRNRGLMSARYHRSGRGGSRIVAVPSQVRDSNETKRWKDKREVAGTRIHLAVRRETVSLRLKSPNVAPSRSTAVQITNARSRSQSHACVGDGDRANHCLVQSETVGLMGAPGSCVTVSCMSMWSCGRLLE